MSAKRRRDEEDGDDAAAENQSVTQLVVRPATVCESILGVTRTWRDKCGSLYHIESKMYVTRDSIQLKLGFFDELECAKILKLLELPLPGNYAIQSASCDLKKQLVLFTITRGGGASKRQKPALQASGQGGGEPDLLRLRTVHDVKEADAGHVHEALASVTRAFERPGDWNLLRCAQRPAVYVLYLRIHAAEIPHEALRAAAAHRGVVDFEAEQLTFTCGKKASDIDC